VQSSTCEILNWPLQQWLFSIILNQCQRVQNFLIQKGLYLSLSIKDANEAYLKAAARSEASKCGSYIKLTGVQQAQIVRYAFVHGNKEAIRYYTKQYCVPEIAESSVSI